ncbi:hypothetical protein HELRODRAFT_114110 [Helobdella robusta]|uniref:Carboxylesterase type B domain-containing protein n=1 Tax=Helobdella robusta TaxID=6412 RepID=T1EFZ0_HELRO|nr:hypothetical protein HELRODRAFT_114110 [Helobdella robusta]ESN97682.1 hypothetical protein HELRODRAFT_114110 [Helobdella robusta]
MMGVVVVTINYRLEILGFLTAADNILPGNYGLRDVVMALNWVHDNIASFRGDASRVTLVGHSVGSALVGILMTLPSTQGLFWTAVTHSGSAAAYYSCFTNQSTNFTEYIRSFGLAVGCEDNNYNVTRIKSCLKNVSTDSFLEFNQQFNSAFGVEYRPMIDNKLLMEHPREAFKAGRYHKVPVYTGVVQNEFSYIIDHVSQFGSESIKSEMLRLQNEMMTCNSGKMLSIIESIELNYIDWNQSLEFKQNNNTKDDFIKYNYYDLANDILMIAPSLFLSDVLSATNPDVFFYYFEHEKSLHVFDINYIFGVPFGNEPVENYVWNKKWNESTVEDQKLSEKMLKLWVSIFQNSKPDPIDGITWPRYNKTTQHYITISMQPTTIGQYFRIKTNYFWNTYLPKFFQKICGNTVHEWSAIFTTPKDRAVVFQSEIFILLLPIVVEMIFTISRHIGLYLL